MSKSIYIPERFEKAVIVHALRLLWLRQADAPLLLGIHGYPGEGKTFQCKKTLENSGFSVFQISGGKLESKDAGEPASVIRDVYSEAQKWCTKSSQNRAALIIDDADAAFGNWGDLYQYTVNTQNLLAELMNLADYHKSNEYDSRIPIYLTGNDLTKLYAPLKRTGRMNFFYWEPDEEERLKLLYFTFPSLSEKECRKLYDYVSLELRGVGRVSNSFFTDIKACAYDELIWNIFSTARTHTLVGDVLKSMGRPSELPEISLDQIKKIADIRIKEIKKASQKYL